MAVRILERTERRFQNRSRIDETVEQGTQPYMADSLISTSVVAAPRHNRWLQLVWGLICMIVISSPQYVWALFTQPLMATLGASLTSIQVTFSILIVVQTFLSPAQGLLVDRFGPRLLLSIGALLTGLSWILAAKATTVMALYLTYGLLGGIGTGIIYIGVVGHMVQWFPDKRGLATGLVAAGYGVGAILTTFPIAAMMRASSHQRVMAQFGVIFAVVGFLAAQGLRRPDPDWRAPGSARRSTGSHPGKAHGTSARLRCSRRQSFG